MEFEMRKIAPEQEGALIDLFVESFRRITTTALCSPGTRPVRSELIFPRYFSIWRSMVALWAHS